LVTPANKRTSVRAGVQKDPHLAIATAHEEKRPARHVAASVITWILNLGLMAQIQPTLAKHSLLLHLKDLRRRHSRAMDSEDALFGVVYDKAFELHHVWPPSSSLVVSLTQPNLSTDGGQVGCDGSLQS